MKWIEDRSENLISTGFARDFHMHGEIALKNDGTMLGLRTSLLADEGAFHADAQPSKFKVGLFHIVTGSLHVPGSHVVADGYYTNKAPGGVAYRCSFRVTEASYLIERLVQNAAYELGMDPADIRKKNFIPEDAFPYEVGHRVRLRLRELPGCDGKALEMIGYDELRAGAGGGARRGQVRDRPGVVHRGRRRRPAQGLRHHRRQDERRRRAANPPDRQGHPQDSSITQGRATRRRSPRSSPRSSGSSPRTSRCSTATRTTRPTASAPTHRGRPRRRRGDGDGAAPGPREGAEDRRAPARGRRDDVEFTRPNFTVKGAPEKAITIQDVAFAAYTNFPDGIEPGLEGRTTTTRPT